MNIFSLAEDPVAGTLLNPTCAAKTGIEYVNYAFVTKNGRPGGAESARLPNGSVRAFERIGEAHLGAVRLE